jgi:hypothetical protein
MGPLFPMLAGASLLGFLFMGKKAKGGSEPPSVVLKATQPATQAAAAAASKAAKEANWQEAVAQAIKSKDQTAIRAVIAALNKAGKSAAAKDLARTLGELQAAARAASNAKAKPAAKPPAKAPTKPAAKPPVKALPKPAPKPTKPAAVKPAPAPKSPEETEAIALQRNLTGVVRGKEDKAQVKAFQTRNKVAADGLYGPGTARLFWTRWKVVPPNPLYWPAVQTVWKDGKESASYAKRDKALADYRAFLDQVAKEGGNVTAAVRAAVGK